MSVNELREFIATAKGTAEQLSFLEHECAKKNERIKALEDEQTAAASNKSEAPSPDIEKLTAEYEEKLVAAERKAAIDMANYRESVRKEHENAINAEREHVANKYKERIARIEQKHSEEINKAKETATAEYSQSIANEARTNAENAVKEEINMLRKAISDLEGSKGELERKLKLSDSAIITFKLYLNDMQDSFNKLVEFVSGLDGDQSQSCKIALSKVMEQLNAAAKAVIGGIT